MTSPPTGLSSFGIGLAITDEEPGCRKKATEKAIARQCILNDGRLLANRFVSPPKNPEVRVVHT